MTAPAVLLDDNGVSLTAAPSGVMTLVIDRGENVFNPALVTSLNAALDKVEEREHPKALIVTGTSGTLQTPNKFFSNGFDLAFFSSHPGPEVSALVQSAWRFFGRVLVMDCRTVAAINGHGFGAGLFMALACDWRVMRTQRGFLNWPELNLGMALGVGLAELTKAKVTDPRVLREGILTGRRYDSAAALAAGLIDRECAVEHLGKEATLLAEQGLAKNLGLTNFVPESLRQMKIEMYTDAYRALVYGKPDDDAAAPVVALEQRSRL